MNKIVEVNSVEQLELQLGNWLNPLNDDEEGPIIQIPLYLIQRLIWKNNDSFYLELLKNKKTEIEKQIKKLREAGIIKRNGADFGGYWEIVNLDND